MQANNRRPVVTEATSILFEHNFSFSLRNLHENLANSVHCNLHKSKHTYGAFVC